MRVSFHEASIEQLPELLAFFAEQYSPDYILARDERFFRWMFGGAAPNGGEDQVLKLKVASVEGHVAGCIGYVPVEFSAGGRVVRGAWAANWMVAESYRRLGLGPLLIRELAASFDVTLALGGNRDAHDLLPRMGWTDFGDLRRYVAVLNPQAAGLLSVTGTIEWPPAPQIPPGGSRDVIVAQVARFSEEATALWDRLYGHCAGTRRTADYLNWRYEQHPNFQYRLFESRMAGTLTGIAVYRIEEVRDVPVRMGRLVEMIATDEDAVTLLAAVLDDGRGHGVAAFDFFCSSSRVAPVLERAGFLPGERAPAIEVPMLFQPIDRSRTGVLFMAHTKKVTEAGQASDWYVTSADGDQDRPN